MALGRGWVVVLVGLVTATPLQAQMTLEQKCETISQIAEQVMVKRQTRVSMSEALAAYDQLENGPVKRWVRDIVLSAYESPRYGSREHQLDAIRDFADQNLAKCLRLING